MEVSSLPIAPSYKEKLISAGYTNLESIVTVSHSRLAQGARTAWEMLLDEQNLKHISTGSEDFDSILGGGIHCGEVTEVGGVPGIGKTQLGMQLAVNVQIPLSSGGLGAKAIYIDTEGSFMPERAYQIAEACISDIQENFVIPPKEIEDCQERMQPDHFLTNILYFRICSYTENIAMINYLDKLLEIHNDVKIVIIDSISFHFRQDFKDMVHRTNVLTEMSRQLMKLSKKFSLSVVLLNQVTTKRVDGSFQLTLALGDTWSHSCTNRIMLYWDGEDRNARIEKSPSLPTASAPFSVTRKGIRNAVSHCKRLRRI